MWNIDFNKRKWQGTNKKEKNYKKRQKITENSLKGSKNIVWAK